jgi:hypothetical protein
MREQIGRRPRARRLVLIVAAAALAWPAVGAAQTVTGQARVVQVGALGITVLADTGTLGSTGDARDAVLAAADVPSILSGEVLHAVTVGWADQVASEASMASLALTAGLAAITADFVMAQALAVTGATTKAVPNQRIAIPGGQLIINEQISSPGGTTVNALHATVPGIADIVIASATAGIR